jgi:hypothetical protein
MITEWYTGDDAMGFSIQEHVLLAMKNPNRMFVIFGYDGSASSGKIWGSVGTRFMSNI